MPRTLYDKIWADHVVEELSDGSTLLYIDRHLVHEVTSPQAFEGLRTAGRGVRHPESTLAVPDHNVATTGRAKGMDGITDETARAQLAALEENTARFQVPYIPLTDRRQGIVHVIGPEQGFTLPGTTIVCGDSHTSTHGAFGALAFGIGTSEVEHVLATQTLVSRPSKNMKVTFEGRLPAGVSAKDMALKLIGTIGTAGGTGHVMEYTGEAVEHLSMEGRMTLCNMSIEAGARAGLVAPDATTFSYLEGRPMAPSGRLWEQALTYWQGLPTETDAKFDKELTINVASLPPQVTWGTNPEMVADITATIPAPQNPTEERALAYMGLTPGQKLEGLPVDVVFIGSCTNARIEDFRTAAEVLKGRKIAKGVRALAVPGSGLVKEQAEAEGLDKIFLAAGFEWRDPGCSMCLAMNNDRLEPGQRCAATSNRNFEGRQGRGGRTHLMSPAMAAAAAVAGALSDVRQLA